MNLSSTFLCWLNELTGLPPPNVNTKSLVRKRGNDLSNATASSLSGKRCSCPDLYRSRGMIQKRASKSNSFYRAPVASFNLTAVSVMSL